MQLERLKILHQAMKRFVEMAGVKEFEKLLDHEGLLDELEIIYHTKHAEVVRIWTQPNMSEQVWANYKALGVENLEEQIELNNALLKLRNSVQGLINRANQLNKIKENSK